MAKKAKNALEETGRKFCENTSLHGFSLWILPGMQKCFNEESSKLTFISFLENKVAERLFWVATVLLGFTCASTMLSEAIVEWMNSPTRKRFSILHIINAMIC